MFNRQNEVNILNHQGLVSEFKIEDRLTFNLTALSLSVIDNRGGKKTFSINGKPEECLTLEEVSIDKFLDRLQEDGYFRAMPMGSKDANLLIWELKKGPNYESIEAGKP